ncbi:MAG: PLP-dependent aminotransferase family protein [Bacteroidales bacterium]|nr:PLP-dependent aminotransferase family protein [Bacteroidales bacterium]
MKTEYDSFLSSSCKNIPSSFLREILDLATQPGMISFAGGLPNPELFPVEPIKQALQKVLTEDGQNILQYSGSQGYLPLREWLCQRYNNKYSMKVTPDMMLITSGSQQALDLSSKILINPGNPLILEKPSYLGAIQAFSAYSPQFIQVKLEHDGINTDDLEYIFKTLRPKVLYAIPNFQNPSGISYSLEKRMQVAELLDKYNAILIEDDPYNEVRFEGDMLPPIYFFNPERVIWCGSFSKMLSPGIRTGWICCSKDLMPYFLRAKQATDLHTNNLVQRMIHSYLMDQDVDSHLQSIQKAYKFQKDTMREMLLTFFPRDTQLTNPEGGMFIWASLTGNINTSDLVTEAINNKVVFVPGRTFYTQNEGNDSMRLNFSNSSPMIIEQGIQKLGKLITKHYEALKT